MMGYSKSLLWSVAFHLAIFCLLLVDMGFRAQSYTTKKTVELQVTRPVVETTVISEKQLNEEIQRIQTIKQQKIASEAAKRQALLDEARELRLKKKAEAKRLAKLKKRVARIKKQRALEQKRQKQRDEQLQAERKKTQERLEREKKKIAALKKKRDAEEKRQAQLKKQQEIARKQQLERELALKAQEEKRINGVVDRYKALILSAISQNWIVPTNANKALSSQFEIKLSPQGKVLSMRLLRSSGDDILDRSARMAILKAQPLPVPTMPEAYALFKVISLTVRPEEAIS